MRKKDFKTPPENNEIIVFKSYRQNYPEIGIYQTVESGNCVFIPSYEDVEYLENIEWWSELPK